MASTVPPIPNHVYIIIQKKMEENVNSIVTNGLYCEYGGTNDVSLVGG
jgi:hypothetical protein